MPISLERRALTLVGEVMGLLELSEFCGGLLRALREAIPAEWSALNEVPADLPHTVSITEPPVPRAAHTAFARYALQNPIAAYYLSTRDGRAMRISDFITRRELHQLALYREAYAPIGLEYQIAFTLPSDAERILGVTLSRTKRDFSATERDLLNLCRPYVIQAYRNAIAHSALARTASRGIAVADLRALGLTARQAEILRLVAMGNSNEDAAAALQIRARTVQKHLEHCFQTLGVTSRSQAARAAWEAGQPGDRPATGPEIVSNGPTRPR